MDTVRLARDLGDVSGLLPTGVDHLRDIPYELLQAIKTALIYLSFEEMPLEDRPPRTIWTDVELLNAHMDEVRRKWKRGDRGGDDGDSGSGNRARNGALRMLVAR